MSNVTMGVDVDSLDYNGLRSLVKELYTAYIKLERELEVLNENINT